MSWEVNLQNHIDNDSSLKELHGNIYWDFAPVNAALPYLIIQQIASMESTSWDGGSGGSFPDIRLTVWTRTRLAANTLRRKVRESLENAEVGAASITVTGYNDHIDTGMEPILFAAIIDLRLQISDKQ